VEQRVVHLQGGIVEQLRPDLRRVERVRRVREGLLVPVERRRLAVGHVLAIVVVFVVFSLGRGHGVVQVGRLVGGEEAGGQALEGIPAQAVAAPVAAVPPPARDGGPRRRPRRVSLRGRVRAHRRRELSVLLGRVHGRGGHGVAIELVERGRPGGGEDGVVGVGVGRRERRRGRVVVSRSSPRHWRSAIFVRASSSSPLSGFHRPARTDAAVQPFVAVASVAAMRVRGVVTLMIRVAVVVVQYRPEAAPDHGSASISPSLSYLSRRED
jgi:hypothetical protein